MVRFGCELGLGWGVASLCGMGVDCRLRICGFFLFVGYVLYFVVSNVDSGLGLVVPFA